MATSRCRRAPRRPKELAGEGSTWLLDPIDGTVSFAHDSSLCGISLALVEGGRPRLAVVDLPLLGERYVAVEGAGSFLNGRRLSVGRRALHEAVIGFTDFSVGRDAPGAGRRGGPDLQVLRRGGRPRPEPSERPPVIRYEWPCPGQLLHQDVKKFGKFTEPGHRITGDRTQRSRRIGWEYVHSIRARNPATIVAPGFCKAINNWSAKL
jgi:hypothetical protein